jgi:hypothetical protein
MLVYAGYLVLDLRPMKLTGERIRAMKTVELPFRARLSRFWDCTEGSSEGHDLRYQKKLMITSVTTLLVVLLSALVSTFIR